MKKLTLLFLIFTFFVAYGQETKEVRHVDTLKTIKLNDPSDLDIQYLKKDIEFRFSRTQTLNIFGNLLDEMKKELNASNEIIEWQQKNLREYEKVFGYMTKQKNLILANPLEIDTIKSIKQIQKNISLMAAIYFYEIACEMLDSGDLMLIENGKRQKKIIKAEVCVGDQYSARTSINYFSIAGTEIWECPPITLDDY